jgi:hypothetical protein
MLEMFSPAELFSFALTFIFALPMVYLFFNLLRSSIVPVYEMRPRRVAVYAVLCALFPLFLLASRVWPLSVLAAFEEPGQVVLSYTASALLAIMVFLRWSVSISVLISAALAFGIYSFVLKWLGKHPGHGARIFMIVTLCEILTLIVFAYTVYALYCGLLNTVS